MLRRNRSDIPCRERAPRLHPKREMFLSTNPIPSQKRQAPLLRTSSVSRHKANGGRTTSLPVPIRNTEIRIMKRTPLPSWLDPSRDLSAASRNMRRSFEYWTQIYWATPPWQTEEQRKQIREIYRNRKPGEEADHIVPLKSPIVCGLHVPWNLQNLPAGTNQNKGNHYWPGHPCENEELYPLEFNPHQLKLI